MTADVPNLLWSHRSWLRRLAHDLVREDDADDVVQETMRIAIQCPPDQPGTLRTWLQRVAQNAAGRMRRTQQRQRTREQAASARQDGVATPEQILVQQELVVAVATAVQALDEPYRTTVHLRYYEGLPPRQIAQRTGANVATVKTRLHRARTMLRETLDRRTGRNHWQPAVLATTGAEPTIAAIAFAMSAKTKLVVAAAVALLAMLPLLFPSSAARALPPAAGPANPVVESASMPAPIALERDVVPPPPPRRGITGRTALMNGDAVAGVRFWAFLGPHPDHDQGRWTRTEKLASAKDGTFTIAIDDGIEAMLLLLDARWQLVGTATGNVVKAVAPADLTLQLQALPTARLVVRAHDLGTGQALQSFRCSFHVPAADSDWPTSGKPYHGGSQGESTRTGEIEFHVPIRDGAPARVQVDLVEPGKARERISLRADETRVVELGVRTGERIRGVVVDPAGRPIEGALVFAGTQVRARGDEPGKPFLADRIEDGVKTDAHGMFELAATSHVTAWHREYSPRTVRITGAYRIELGPLGTVRGRLLDAAGGARAATELRLDRTIVANTDASGAFQFANVEGGARLVYVPGTDPTRLTGTDGGPWVVHVRAGEVSETTLGTGLAELQVDLTGHGEATTLALVGLTTGTSLAFGKIANGTVRLPNVVHGDYQLITDRGALLRVAVTGPQLAVALGQEPASSWLVIETDEPTAFHVVPSDADDMVRTLVARVVRLRPDAGRIGIGPLPPGDYEVCRGDAPAGESVPVLGKETKFTPTNAGK